MNCTLALGITALAIEIVSFLIKKFAPEWAGAIPIINTFIGFAGAYVFRIDLGAGLLTSGSCCVVYDFIHGIHKIMKNATGELK